MTKIMRALKQQWLMRILILCIALGAVSMLGCAGSTRSSTTTTETSSGTLGSGSTSSVTTQNQVVTSSHPRGVIGGLFYTIGQVLIFPFKLIGSLFS